MNHQEQNKYFKLYVQYVDDLLLPSEGEEVWATCPFHEDEARSLKINLESGDCRCESCQFTADAYGFYREIENADFVTAVNAVERLVGSHNSALPVHSPDDCDEEHGDYSADGTDDADDHSQNSSRVSKLVHLVLENYVVGICDEGDTFAVPRGGPKIARMLESKGGLQADLAFRYFERYGSPVGQNIINDAILYVRGLAAQQPRTQLYLRYALVDNALWVDLGDETGRCIQVTEDDWSMEREAPVIFKRTSLTRPMPEPERGGRLSELREFLTVEDDGWKLIIGCLVGALLPDVDHPILLFVGEQGSAKSTTAKMLVTLLDPSVVAARCAPRDILEWVVTAAASQVLLLDNMSKVPEWLSDALCRAVTGEALPRRKLYSDNELTVSTFKRQVFITGIELGNLAGDLLDRAVQVEMQPLIGRYRSLSQLETEFTSAHPRILAGLLDAVSAVLEFRGAMHAEDSRLADHACVLKALDEWGELGHGFYDAMSGNTGRVLAEAVEGDPVAMKVVEYMARRNGETWTGTMSELLSELTKMMAPDDPARRYFPTTPQYLSRKLSRLAPNLRAAGIGIDRDRRNDRNRSRYLTLVKMEEPSSGASGASGASASS